MNVVMSKQNIVGYIVACASIALYGEQNRPSLFEQVCKNSAPFIPTVSGYIKHESFFDSRQVVAFGDDDSLLWPKNKVFDSCCTDINAQSQFNMVPIETVVSCKWCGPTIGNAKTSALVEGDFFGPTDPLSLISIVNIIQLRHAFMQFDWDHMKVLAGHCYHPLITLDCYPNTVSNNTGSPFDPYSRCSQIRLTYHKHTLHIMAAAMMQLNYPSEGPIGLSTTYERDAIIPNVHAQAWFQSEHCTVGAGIDYKLLKPRLKTDTGYKTSTMIGSSAAMLYCSLKSKTYTINSKILYGQNLTDMSMIGGYAVHSIDSTTHQAHYTTLNVVSWWSDIAKTLHNFEPGIFLGLCKNLGAQQSIHPDQPFTIYALGANIDTVMRISPRLRWSCTESLIFGCEAEYTSASYGTIQRDGTVAQTDRVGNVRLLAALYYNF